MDMNVRTSSPGCFFLRVISRRLDEWETKDSRLVFLQLFFVVLQLAASILRIHVDKINNDYPADISKP